MTSTTPTACASNITNAIASGVNMAFFSANNFYYRITWAPGANGRSNRRIHCDKNALPRSKTYEWRLLSPQHPENEIGGVMLQGVAARTGRSSSPMQATGSTRAPA